MRLLVAGRTGGSHPSFGCRDRRRAGTLGFLGAGDQQAGLGDREQTAQAEGLRRGAPGAEAEFLAPLGVGKLPGIGAKTEPRLEAVGIRTVADLLAAPEGVLRRFFGDGFEAMLAMARGEDSAPVETVEWEAKSYSLQETFARDIADFAEIERIAKRMIDELVPKLREDGKCARTITVKIRYPGMEDVSAGHSLPAASDLETDFYPQLAPLLRGAWRQKRPLRLVSVRLSQVEEPVRQLELFGAVQNEKRHKLAAAVDALKRVKGEAAVTRGHQLRRTAPGASGARE